MKPQSGTVIPVTFSIDGYTLTMLTNGSCIDMWTTNLSLEIVVKLKEDNRFRLTMILLYQLSVSLHFIVVIMPDKQGIATSFYVDWILKADNGSGVTMLMATKCRDGMNGQAYRAQHNI